MKNHEVYLHDPRTWSLVNDGVARVNEPATAKERATLRGELELFVCEGEYAHGMAKILERYVDNLERGAQPGVWVSGFYGSGKSHFVKMLRALWNDLRFDDGATARGLVKNLAPEVSDALKHLSTRAKQLGINLHAASGALTSGAGGSVRRAVVKIVFESLGFDGEFPVGSFELWLRDEGLLTQVRDAVHAKGLNWAEERANFYVSPDIASAVLAARPGIAKDEADLHALLAAQFTDPEDISTDKMVSTVRRALQGKGGSLPLTLIALDEVQQFIGEQPSRAIEVQEVAEALQKQFDARVLVIATGQSAMNATPLLEKIQARFTLPVPLSDQDVEQVIRKVVLQKSPAAIGALDGALESNLAEIARQLPDTTIRYRNEDRTDLVADYPLLPSRRRFWENCLRAVDHGGVTAQLRNQLSLAFDAAKTTAALPLGNVVGAEFVVESQEVNLLNAGVLPRGIHEKLVKWRAGSPLDRLKARIGTLVFVISRLPREKGSDIMIRATAADLTDLLVTDLSEGGRSLRSSVDAALSEMEASGELMLVDGECRWQTRESALWTQRFREKASTLLSDTTKLQQVRAELFKEQARAALKKLKITQGASNIERDWDLSFSDAPPKADGTTLPFWLRDEWSTTWNDLRNAMLALGVDSPVVAIFLPRRAEDELRRALAERDAAQAVLDAPPVLPGSDPAEREEANKAMESRQVAARLRVDALVRDVFDHAQVMLAGGAEVATPMGASDPFLNVVKSAAQQAVDRLFPQFVEADHANWDKVSAKARKGDVDAFKAVGYQGDLLKHKVVGAILKYIGASKTGKEIRIHFAASPFGWPQDAIDAALFTLLASGHLAALENGAGIPLASLDAKKLGVVTLKPQKVVASAMDKSTVRKLLADLGVNSKINEETQGLSTLLDHLDKLAARAGGDAPSPSAPDTALLKELRKRVDQELLVEAASRDADIRAAYKAWKDTAALLDARRPRWDLAVALVAQATGLDGVDGEVVQLDAIRASRLLLASPDPVTPVLESVAQRLRAALLDGQKQFADAYAAGMKALDADESWQKLDVTARGEILRAQQLDGVPEVKTSNAAEVRQSLDERSLANWRMLREALPTRFEAARLAAAKRHEPTVTRVHLPSRTLRTPQEVEAWLAEVGALLDGRVKQGPVIV